MNRAGHAHFFVEVAVYAGAYALASGALALGDFGGRTIADPLDCPSSEHLAQLAA